ncbi:MAG: plasmid pRiA4b ORF-3 family protein, partial [Euryarchaeota archaeon]|nr:plasmid pRiA4b ORF-3 family protein [Euryarchaeota archaeon]
AFRLLCWLYKYKNAKEYGMFLRKHKHFETAKMPSRNHNYLKMVRTINGIKEGTQMKKKYNHVYQFKITLGGSTPPIWRRIQVPETYSFWDLHVAIQDAMGWSGNHLHEFEVVNPSTGLKQIIGNPNDDVSVNAL